MPRSWIFLLVTVALLGMFGAIVVHTYRRKRKEETERPKYRMLEDD